MATYIIRAGLTGPVKIGKADDVEARRADLQTAHHETLHVLRVIDTAFDAEAILHAKFAALRIRGEWFEFDAEMLSWVPEAPLASTAATPTGSTWPEVLAPWSDKEIARRVGCSRAIVKRWRKPGEHGPAFRFIFAMLQDDVLWKAPLLVAGRAELVNSEETIERLQRELSEKLQAAAAKRHAASLKVVEAIARTDEEER